MKHTAAVLLIAFSLAMPRAANTAVAAIFTAVNTAVAAAEEAINPPLYT